MIDDDLISRKEAIEAFQSVDVKRLDYDNGNKEWTKAYRFGNYNALRAAPLILGVLPSRGLAAPKRKPRKKKDA